MLMILAPTRYDSMGSGDFRSPRGERKHSGRDYAVIPGSQIISQTQGEVIKLGYPYPPSDTKKGNYRYIEILSPNNYTIKYFYVMPHRDIIVGKYVDQYAPIGLAQDISYVYGPDMIPHIHVEVRNPEGQLRDPDDTIGYTSKY